MANAFSKEERVMFEDLLAGFDDALVLSKLVKKYNVGDVMAERTNDQIWRPQPYINQSFSGLDQTANFGDVTQLSVPAYINTIRSSPWVLTAVELRDALQEGRIRDGAKQKLASDINVDVNTAICNLGSLVSKRTTAASGFDDVAQIDSLMNEQGVPMDQRFAAYSSRDYNSMASNLAGRQTLQGRPETAYDRAYIGRVASFDTFKMDYAPNLNAATATGVTMNGANQFYTPTAFTLSSTGTNTPINTDNRFQTISITVGASTVKVGDCFTITGVNAVHHITKVDTGQLKTFRVVAIVTGAGGTGTIQITPPIISAQGATAAEQQYKNVTATPAAAAPIVFLNTVTAKTNPFWYDGAVELLPGRLAWPTDAGMNVMTGTTDQGLQLSMVKQGDINTGKVKYRVDVKYGVAVTNTEMCGIQLFSQT